MVPAFDIDSEASIWFDSTNGIEEIKLMDIDEISNKEKQDFSQNEKLNRPIDEITFMDAVYASTTTPSLFGSLEYEGADEEKYRFIDGGEGSEHYNNNNPTFSLIVEALRQGYKRENINVISLGAGRYIAPEGAS